MIHVLAQESLAAYEQRAADVVGEVVVPGQLEVTRDLAVVAVAEAAGAFGVVGGEVVHVPPEGEEGDLGPVADVHAEGAVEDHAFSDRPVGVDTAGEVLDVLKDVAPGRLAQRRERQAAVAVVVVGKPQLAHQSQREDSEDVVAAGQTALVALGVEAAHPDAHIVEGEDAEVQRPLPAHDRVLVLEAAPVGEDAVELAERAVLVVVAPRGEVLDEVAAAGDRPGIGLAVPGVVELAHVVDFVHLVRLEADAPAVLHPGYLLRVAREVGVGDEAVEGRPDRGLVRLDRPPGRALLPALGEDLDDPVGRLGAVQRRRRGTLEDLDALDRGRVDVVDPARCRLRRTPATGAATVDTHAIKVDDGFVRLRKRRGSANADASAATGVPAAGEADDTCFAPLEHVAEAGDRRILKVGDVHRGDRVAELLLLCGDARSRDHDLVKLDRGDREAEVNGRTLAGGDGHGLRSRPVTDQLGDDRVLPDRRVHEEVPAGAVGQRTEGRALDVDLGRLQRPARRRVGDLSRDGAGLGGRRGCEGKAGQHGQAKPSRPISEALCKRVTCHELSSLSSPWTCDTPCIYVNRAVPGQGLGPKCLQSS